MKYLKKKLTIENVKVDYIAKKYGTPTYCYSYSELKKNINNFKNSFKSFSPIICFAVKSNTNINLIKEIKKFGLGADVVSMGELMMAIKAGINPKKIVFSGVGKTFDEILKNLSPNKKRMLELASYGYITATDLADYLVTNHSMPFRKAYQKTAKIVNFAEKKKKRLNELTLQELRMIEPKLTKEVLKVFDLKNSVKTKKSYGGTSLVNIKIMIMNYKKQK